MTIEGLGPRIASALDQRFGRGYDFSLGRTFMSRHGLAPTLGVDGLTLKDSSGHTIFTAPRAEVSVALLPLIGGRVVPKRLEVFDVEVRLALLPDGSIAQPIAPGSDETVALTPPLADQLVKEGAPSDLLLAPPAQSGAAQGAGAPAEPKPRALLVKQMASALRLLIDALTNPDSQVAAVDRVGITRGRVVIDDRSAHQKMTFDGVNLSFDRRSGSTTFNLSVDGPNGRWSANGLASGAPHAERRLMLSLQNLSIDEILLATGARSIGADFDMPLSAKFSVGLRPDGVLSEAVGNFDFGAGYFRWDDPKDEPMMVDSIHGGLHWDGAARRIVVDPVRLTCRRHEGRRRGLRRLAGTRRGSLARQHPERRSLDRRARPSGPEDGRRRLRRADLPPSARRKEIRRRPAAGRRSAGGLCNGRRRRLDEWTEAALRGLARSDADRGRRAALAVISRRPGPILSARSCEAGDDPERDDAVRFQRRRSRRDA